MRVLVTNDDGVDSPGLAALAAVATRRGHEVVIAAPAWDSSGASASLTAVEHDGRLLLDRRTIPGLDGVAVFAVEAAPAYIVRVGTVGAFGAPFDLVLSGINSGPNTGHAVLHSGTVGAALTASTFGLPSLAVSLDGRVGDEVWHWATAAEFADVALGWLPAAPPSTVINVNVPNRPPGSVTAFRSARLAPYGAVQTTITEADDGAVKLAYDEVDADFEPGTDAAFLRDGVACFTTLRPVCEGPELDAPATR